MRCIHLPEGKCIMCVIMKKQEYVCVCVCCVYVHTAAFELQAEAINKDCSEMRHESSSASTAEL